MRLSAKGTAAKLSRRKMKSGRISSYIRDARRRHRDVCPHQHRGVTDPIAYHQDVVSPVPQPGNERSFAGPELPARRRQSARPSATLWRHLARNQHDLEPIGAQSRHRAEAGRKRRDNQSITAAEQAGFSAHRLLADASRSAIPARIMRALLNSVRQTTTAFGSSITRV